MSVFHPPLADSWNSLCCHTSIDCFLWTFNTTLPPAGEGVAHHVTHANTPDSSPLYLYSTVVTQMPGILTPSTLVLELVQLLNYNYVFSERLAFDMTLCPESSAKLLSWWMDVPSCIDEALKSFFLLAPRSSFLQFSLLSSRTPCFLVTLLHYTMTQWYNNSAGFLIYN